MWSDYALENSGYLNNQFPFSETSVMIVLPSLGCLWGGSKKMKSSQSNKELIDTAVIAFLQEFCLS